ncbi:MAG: 2-dehydropantoate 2-reductase, partial [Candidatus Hydrothermarchaeota archaeon]|nr:2-dehydropantoate 2-reductase [Candidatus Hydrothermarchaeota archaeon]
MKVAVMGAGAVGGYFGGVLAKSGADITLIARGKHLEAMRKDGLLIKSYRGDFRADVKATSDPKEAGPTDLILFTVKSYDTEEAIRLCRPMIQENTCILSLQNGIDNDEKIAREAGREKIIGGVAYIGVALDEPGVILHSAAGKIAIGELNGKITHRIKKIAEMFSAAWIPCEISEDIIKLKWKKLVWNAAFNALTTITGASVALVLVSGIILFFIVYHLYAKWFDQKIIQVDPEKSTPARTYLDGVEFFPTNKNILFGFQFKGIAGLSPVVGPIVAIMWGWLPALLWILLGNIFIGWVQDYMSAMVSVRNEGQSFGPLSYRLISSRTRKLLMLFMVFYLILLAAAFVALGAGLLKANVLAGVPTMFVLAAAVLVGHMIYKMKMNPVNATVIGLVLVAVGLYIGSNVPVSIADINIWIIFILAVSIIAATTPIYRFTQPALYMFFYVVYFTLVALVLALIFKNPAYVRPAYAGFIVGPENFPLWPMMFVTIACGSISGWHSLVSSSATAKQIEKETDVRPVCCGAMFSEGLLALLALSIVAILTAKEATALGGAAAIFSKSGASILGGSALVQALVGLMFIGLTLGLMLLAMRIARLALSELAGDAIPPLKNRYISAIAFSIIVFLLA